MTQLELVKSKILTVGDFAEKLAYHRFREQKLVFTNGCFDILHLGHVDYLSKAADLGDILIVGLNTDESVSRIKGEKRPVQDLHSRSYVLASLRFIDYVVPFDQSTPYELIKFINPDILIKGGDYKPEEIVGYDIVKDNGGQVFTIDLTPGYSTTSILNRI